MSAVRTDHPATLAARGRALSGLDAARDRIERVIANGLEANYAREKLSGAVRRLTAALRFIDLGICAKCNGTGARHGAWCMHCGATGLVELEDGLRGREWAEVHR